VVVRAAPGGGRRAPGKSTLLRLLAGRPHPSQGSVTVQGTIASLPQNITLDTQCRFSPHVPAVRTVQPS
jgi:ABC-type polysaccharide/polyol phosphate transport system ATPase subunit